MMSDVTLRHWFVLVAEITVDLIDGFGHLEENFADSFRLELELCLKVAVTTTSS